jgi:hypothetical protein
VQLVIIEVDGGLQQQQQGGGGRSPAAFASAFKAKALKERVGRDEVLEPDAHVPQLLQLADALQQSLQCP